MRSLKNRFFGKYPTSSGIEISTTANLKFASVTFENNSKLSGFQIQVTFYYCELLLLLRAPRTSSSSSRPCLSLSFSPVTGQLFILLRFETICQCGAALWLYRCVGKQNKSGFFYAFAALECSIHALHEKQKLHISRKIWFRWQKALKFVVPAVQNFSKSSFPGWSNICLNLKNLWSGSPKSGIVSVRDTHTRLATNFFSTWLLKRDRI